MSNEVSLNRDFVINISRDNISITRQGFGIPLILTNEDSGWDASERYRSYSSLTEVAEDFSTSSRTYLMANLIFSQNPKVSEIKIGNEDTRVAQVSTIEFSATIITGNTISIDVDGETITQAFDTNNATTLTALAAQIQALPQIATASSNGSDTITVTAQTAGVGFSLANAEVTGGLTQATIDLATTTDNHGPAEDIDEIIDQTNDFYIILWIERNRSLVKKMSAKVETLQKIFVTSDDDTNILLPANTDNILYDLRNLNYDRTVFAYKSDEADFLDAAITGEILPYDAGSATWKWKNMNGITADSFTTTQLNSIKNKKGNYYITTAGVDYYAEGYVVSGEWADIIMAIDYITIRMQEALFELFVTNPKIPMTDEGGAAIEGTMRMVLEESKSKNLIAIDDDFPNGYTIHIPKVSTIPVQDRVDRIFSGITFRARLAGAVHAVVINGNVSV